MGIERKVGEASSWPFYKEVGCRVCNDTKSELIMVRTKTDKFGNDIEEKGSPFICYEHSKESPLWKEYFGDKQKYDEEKKKEILNLKNEVKGLIAKASDIELETDDCTEFTTYIITITVPK
jgi:hypothetical protein